MLTMLLAISLAYDPIPKKGDEGYITICKSLPSPSMLVMSPAGRIEKTFEFDLSSEQFVTSQICHDMNHAFVQFRPDTQMVTIGDTQVYNDSLFLFELKDRKRQKTLVEKRAQLNWVVSRDESKVYGSNFDETKARNIAKKNLYEMPSRSWVIDLKTGKESTIPLPDNHRITDLSRNGKYLLTQVFSNKKKGGQFHAAIVPVDTMKPEVLSEHYYHVHCISPDGKKIVVYSSNSIDTRGSHEGFIIYDLETRSKKKVPIPDHSQPAYKYSYSPDGQSICFITSYNDGKDYGRRLYKLHANGTGLKMIYESKQMGNICIWR